MTGKHGAVMLFVSGLSDRVTRKELKSIFRNLIKSRWWTTRWTGQGMIRSCDIIRITDRDTGDVEYHGLVELQPAKLALHAIRELSGTEIGGRPIEIHRYHHRSPFRNRHRYLNSGETVELDHIDRRRPNLTIELVGAREAALLPALGRWLTPQSKQGYELKGGERHTV